MLRLPRDPKYHDRARWRADSEPCCICGRDVKVPEGRLPKFLNLTIGDDVIGPSDVVPRDHDLGWYAVGVNCLRKHPELKSYAK